MSFHSVDICDQSRKLWEIAPNFAGFCPPKFYCGRPSKTCTQISTADGWHV